MGEIMSRRQASTVLSSAELAAHIGCLKSEIEALARTRRWPRIDSRDGMKVAIDFAMIRQAMGRSGAPFMDQLVEG